MSRKRPSGSLEDLLPDDRVAWAKKMCDRKCMKRLAIILALMGGPVGAEVDTGNFLINTCNDTSNDGISIQKGYCIGYISGVWEGLKLGAAMPMLISGEGSVAETDQITNIILGVCLPEQVERGQMVEVVMKYLTENPETRHEPARWLTRTALAEAFPCQ